MAASSVSRGRVAGQSSYDMGPRDCSSPFRHKRGIMKILCAGDLHIGRRPSRLPGNTDGHTLSAAVAWEAIVDQAVRREVDLVALSGDVVDRDNRFYEAIGPLERGLRRLHRHGIETVAVAGNHDHDVLPRLASQMAGHGFHLLGQDGRWERHVLERDGRPALEIHGWSFPDTHVTSNPLRTHNLPIPSGVPVLGLLHTDLDQSGSQYAPTSIADLRSKQVSVWLIGHVHGPRVRAKERPLVLNPGSPQALDPGEPGPHGAWLLELAPGVPMKPVSIPLTRVRYDRVDVDLTGQDDGSSIGEKVNEALDGYIGDELRSVGPLRHALIRLHLIGKTSLHGALDTEIDRILELDKPAGDATVRIEKVVAETEPEIVLADLADAPHPAGKLAAMLLDLQSGDPSEETRALVRRARERIVSVNHSPAYAGLPARPEFMPEDPAEHARAMVVAQGLLLLERMLELKGDPS